MIDGREGYSRPPNISTTFFCAQVEDGRWKMENGKWSFGSAGLAMTLRTRSRAFGIYPHSLVSSRRSRILPLPGFVSNVSKFKYVYVFIWKVAKR